MFDDNKPQALVIAEKLIYNPLGLSIKNLMLEVEGKEYSACQFTLNNYLIKFRSGKITPTKRGQFVTFWKRSESGPIMPYDAKDHFDFLTVSVNTKTYLGYFIFPKYALIKYGLISEHEKGGKRAMRVYPSWDQTDNKQSKGTQQWQLKYFFEIDKHQPLDSIKILKLFNG